MSDTQSRSKGTPSGFPQADNTAIRVALWRALHLEADAPPHVLADEVGSSSRRRPTAGGSART